ncbi:hypothetical protein GPECTOR_62g871 [Gonium pectorale]|uniref:Endoglucanase n=1 Tax=Gonium pectorale TaxID=33097 RepID=A0A150G4E9_GONPE|nr:hypothetical protein GPECTOR_62g871 [Gonium pectorale]|eukprot:KXZ44756.1 hypothetical protein GPECTOR_62g871 [Gonium pectorale]
MGASQGADGPAGLPRLALLGLAALLCCSALPRFALSTEYNYTEALDGSYFFYEAQQAGPLPTWNRAARWNGGWRDASFLNDGSDIGKNLTGGWFDAGDHMKFQLPFGWSASTLAWSMVEFPAAYGPPSGSLFQTVRRNLLFAADYIVRSHVNASDVPGENVYAAQIGDTDTDHARWCRPEQCPEIQGPYRPTWVADRTRPGADIVGEAVASLVGVASVLKMENPADPAIPLLMTHARQLYAFAKAFPGTWEIPAGDYPYRYGTHKWQDDMLWAAAWMCRAGEGASYCADAVSFWNVGSNMGIGWCPGMDWDNAFNQASVMMLGMADRFSASFLTTVRTRLDYNLNLWHVSTVCTQPPPNTDSNGDGLVDDGHICYSPKGFAHESTWGTARITANAAALKLAYSKYLPTNPEDAKRQRCWARKQMRLMLGDWGRSFVVGFGCNPPVRPHHSSTMCDRDYSITCDGNTAADPRPNPSVLRGALVGGPRKDDYYVDDRMDYILNEVAIDYNAGFTVALAGLLQLSASTPDWDAYCGTAPTPITCPWACSSCDSGTQPGSNLASQRSNCYSCVNARGVSKSWQCHACVGNATYVASQGQHCLSCVSAGADAWACQSYCTDLSSDIAVLPSCTSCVADPAVRSAGPWRCSVCMAPSVLAKGAAAVEACMSCVRSLKGPYACAVSV